MIKELHRNEFLDDHCDSRLNLFSKYMTGDEVNIVKKKICNIYGLHTNITLTHGSEDSLYKLLLYFRKYFSKLLLTDISWDYYKDLGNKLEYHVDIIESKKEDILEPNEKSLINISSKNHILILGNPCNPSGREISEENLKKIINKNTKIILDCTYQSPEEFNKTVEKYFDYDIIFITSFSKFFGIPGIRLGFFVTKNNLIHKSLELYLGMNNEISNTVNLIYDNSKYYVDIRKKIEKNILLICNKKFKNFDISPSPSFIVLIFKDVVSEYVISEISKLFFCKVKYLKKEKVIIRISVSSKNKDYVLTILDAYDGFLNFVKDNDFTLIRHEKRGISQSYNSFLTPEGMRSSEKLEFKEGQLYSSSYLRCIQTVISHIKKKKVVLNIDHSLDEYESEEDKQHFVNDTIEKRKILRLPFKNYINTESSVIKEKEKPIFNNLYDNIKTKSIDITKFLISLWLKNKQKENYIMVSHQTTIAILKKILTNNEKSIQDLEKEIEMGSITKIYSNN